MLIISFLRCPLYQETFCAEKFQKKKTQKEKNFQKTQKETCYLDNITIVPREIVFIVIARWYIVVSSKIEHKYFLKTLTSVICSVRIYAKVIIQKSTLVL